MKNSNKVFNWASNVNCVCLVLYSFALWLASKTRTTFSTNDKQNQNQSGLTPRAFSRAWRRLHVNCFELWLAHCTVPVCCDRRSYSYSRYWTGSSMKWRLLRGNTFTYEKFPRKSLHFMLDPVQYREHEWGLFGFGFICNTQNRVTDIDVNEATQQLYWK